MEVLKNSIMLQVSVPVLSDSMVSTIPSSYMPFAHSNSYRYAQKCSIMFAQNNNTLHSAFHSFARLLMCMLPFGSDASPFESELHAVWRGV